MRLRALVLVVLACAAVAPARAQEGGGESGGPPRTSVTSVMITQNGATPADAVTITMGLRRGIEARDRLRYADPVDLMSNLGVPEPIQVAIDDLDAVAELVRSGDPAEAERRAQAAIDIFEQDLVDVKRAQLTDAYMLEAVARCRMGDRRHGIEGFERIVTFRESAEYDPQRYPDQYAALFAETKQRVLSGARGSLQVVSDPEGAEVFVDGRSFGPAPAVADGLLAGDHYVTLKRVGYEKLIAKATVTLDETSTARFLMQPIQRALLLDRDLARIPAELGHQRAGPVISGLTGYLVANQAVIGLIEPAAEGELSVELYVYDLRTRFLLSRARANVPRGPTGADRVETLTGELYARVDLSGAIQAPDDDRNRRATPLWGEWWFWTAIGVVVVSAVVITGVILSSGSDIPSGWTRFDGQLP